MEFRDIRKMAMNLSYILDMASPENKGRVENAVGEMLFILESEWATRFDEIEHLGELLALEGIMLSQKELVDLFFKLQKSIGGEN